MSFPCESSVGFCGFSIRSLVGFLQPKSTGYPQPKDQYMTSSPLAPTHPASRSSQQWWWWHHPHPPQSSPLLSTCGPPCEQGLITVVAGAGWLHCPGVVVIIVAPHLPIAPHFHPMSSCLWWWFGVWSGMLWRLLLWSFSL